LKPEDVDISDPPIIVNKIKNKDRSVSDENVDIPEVEIEDTTAKKTFKKLLLGIIKKYINKISKKIKINK